VPVPRRRRIAAYVLLIGRRWISDASDKEDVVAKVVYLDSEQWGDVADPRVDVFAAVSDSLEGARLRREIRRLPIIERHVICWRNGLAGERLGVREVAKRLGIARSTAYDIERRGMERLRAAYAAHIEAA
jgi:DNA-directed RNA polymerase sigma subunit (sigma70/sigma32)